MELYTLYTAILLSPEPLKLTILISVIMSLTILDSYCNWSHIAYLCFNDWIISLNTQLWKLYWVICGVVKISNFLK
jgi:hypothetical protein